MEKSIEALRHAQAKSAELEKNTKKLQEQVLAGRREIARLKEELQIFKTKVLILRVGTTGISLPHEADSTSLELCREWY